MGVAISGNGAVSVGGSGGAVLTAAAQVLYKKKALDFLRKELRFQKSCIQQKLDKNSGLTASYYRIDNMAAATTDLDAQAGTYEGSTPDAVGISSTLFTITPKVYGNWVKTTDLLELTGRSDTREQFSRQLGYNGGLSIDTLAYAAWVAGATAHYSGNTDAGTFAADSIMTSKELRRLAKKFRANSVRPNDDGYFHLTIHPDCEMDIVTDDSFGSSTDLKRRNGEGDKNLEYGTVGIYGGFKVFTSPLVTTTTVNSQTAYQNIASGYGAMLTVDIEGMPFNLFDNPSSNISLANPLARLGSIGWKASTGYSFIGSDGPRAYKVLATASEPTA